MEALTHQLIEWDVAASPRAGERDSGDRFVVAPTAAGALVAVIDGLGHGAEALEAAETAARTLVSHRDESVITLVRRCHEQLRRARGVVMSLASFQASEHTMTWLGVGNVEGRLVRARANGTPLCEFLLLRGGVVGDHLPPLHASLIPIAPGDTLVLATDGVVVPPVEALIVDGPPQAAAERLLARHAKDSDDALVLVARWVGG